MTETPTGRPRDGEKLHTPTPWRVKPGTAIIEQFKDGLWGLIVADCRMTDEGEANAAFIVEAVAALTRPAPSPALDPVTVEACAKVMVKLAGGFGGKSDDYLNGFQTGCNAKSAAIRALIGQPAPSSTVGEREYAALRNNLREAWSALAMIRETVETLGPVGAMRASEHLDGPTFTHEAEEIVSGIRAALSPRSVEAPVAWQYRMLDDEGNPVEDRWLHVDCQIDDFKNDMEHDDYEVRPLYASPLPPDTAVRADGLTQKQVDDAVAMIKIMASTPPKDWLLRSEIHENLADYRAALPPDAGGRK